MTALCMEVAPGSVAACASPSADGAKIAPWCHQDKGHDGPHRCGELVWPADERGAIPVEARAGHVAELRAALAQVSDEEWSKALRRHQSDPALPLHEGNARDVGIALALAERRIVELERERDMRIGLNEAAEHQKLRWASLYERERSAREAAEARLVETLESEKAWSAQVNKLEKQLASVLERVRGVVEADEARPLSTGGGPPEEQELGRAQMCDEIRAAVPEAWESLPRARRAKQATHG